MAKAVTEIAVGAALITTAVATGGMSAILAGTAGPWIMAAFSAGTSFALAGVTGGISDLMGMNAGLAVGQRNPVGPWSIVYGLQKVGGIKIFEASNSNTGTTQTSNDKQLHRVYVLASHPCEIGAYGVWQVLVNGKQVLMQANPNGVGYNSYSPIQSTSAIVSASCTNGLATIVLAQPIFQVDGATLFIKGISDNTFNGIFVVTQPDPTNNLILNYPVGGPDRSALNDTGYVETTYADYRDKIYVEFLDGNHTQTFPTLLAAQTAWSASDLCLGHTLAYVQLGYDPNIFPSSIPIISFIIQGKNDIYDPRTGQTGWTDNAALCVADYMALPVLRGGFGLSLGTDIPYLQLATAANICDEQVALEAGGSQARYTCDTTIVLTQSRGVILQNLLTSCAGRISYQGGEYMIFPGVYNAPTLAINDGMIVSPIEWTGPTARTLANAVKGKYTSVENNWQPSDYPPYAQDQEHGYSTDVNLAADNNVRLVMDFNQPCASTAAQAQRVAKIVMLRTRFWDRIRLQCNMSAYTAVALDVVTVTHARFGWLNKTFEVLSLRVVQQSSHGENVALVCELELQATDPSVYDWSTTEQLSPFGFAFPPGGADGFCNPPENVMGYSGPGATINGQTFPSTLNATADGTINNSIYLSWTPPNDPNVIGGGHFEVQFQRTAYLAHNEIALPPGIGGSTGNNSSPWSSLPNIAPSSSNCFIGPVSDNSEYSVQIQSVNNVGVRSGWVVVTGIRVASSVGTLSYGNSEVAPSGTLQASFANGSAEIVVPPFTATMGAFSVYCSPVPETITGLTSGQLYFVYYVDPDLIGGNILPIATLNPTDFQGKYGYFLIGQILTPFPSAGYLPNQFVDEGTASTQGGTSLFAANPNSLATVNASWSSTYANGVYTYKQSAGSASWAGFIPRILTSNKVLSVTLSTVDKSNSTASFTVEASYGGQLYSLAALAGGNGVNTYTSSIPSGTDLSSVVVTVTALTTTVASQTVTGGTAQALVKSILVN